MAIGAGQVTRFGIGGGIWQPIDISLFGNKEPGDVVTPPTTPSAEGKFGGAMGGYTRTQKRKKLKALIADDEEFMNMVAQALPELIAKIYKI